VSWVCQEVSDACCAELALTQVALATHGESLSVTARHHLWRGGLAPTTPHPPHSHQCPTHTHTTISGLPTHHHTSPTIQERQLQAAVNMVGREVLPHTHRHTVQYTRRLRCWVLFSAWHANLGRRHRRLPRHDSGVRLHALQHPPLLGATHKKWQHKHRHQSSSRSVTARRRHARWHCCQPPHTRTPNVHADMCYRKVSRTAQVQLTRLVWCQARRAGQCRASHDALGLSAITGADIARQRDSHRANN
jgi:hypothetical protein